MKKKIDSGIERTLSSHLFKPSVAFQIETSHLFCSVKETTGFYMKRSPELKWFNLLQITALSQNEPEDCRVPSSYKPYLAKMFS